MTKTVSIGQLLNNSGGGFAQVLNRAKQLRKLTFQLRKMVDAPLCDHIFVANIRDNVLIVGTDSAVWHTRVKYLAPLILEQMKQIKGLENLQRLEFRVQPTNSNIVPTNNSSTNKVIDKNPTHNLKQTLQHLKEKTTDSGSNE